MTAGFSSIFRLMNRRERLGGLIWVLGITGTTLFFSGMFATLFPDPAALQGMASALDTPAMTALMGPLYGSEALTPMIVLSAYMRIWMMLATALMSIFLVCRLTRADEELGRQEMLRSLPVAPLTTAIVAFTGAVVLNVCIALVTAVGLLIIAAPGTTTAGTFSYTFSIAAAGIAFAGIALVSSQLFSTSRGALAGSFGTLWLAYALRASGDINRSALSSVSPLGLGLQVEAFYADRMFPIVLLLLEGLSFVSLALILNRMRDLGEGVLPSRRGKGFASRLMLTPFGFALRLTRNQILLWTIALFGIGVIYGSVMGDIESFTASNETYRQMLAASGAQHGLKESFVAMLLSIYAPLSAIPVMLHALKIRAEEKHGRIEQLMSKSVSRRAMLGSYVGVAALESVLMQLASALGFCAAAGSASPVSLAAILGASLAYLPALWVMMGLCVFLVGALPKATAAGWGLYTFSFCILFFARLASLPAWVVRISPFSNIPQLPVAEYQTLPLLLLTLIAAGLLYAGFRSFGRRDLQAT